MTPRDFEPAPPTATSRLLPIYAHEAELLGALRNHQVVVVQGPTGCGKTTQIPQMLLRSGLFDGVIGVTQPRRIAAVSVSWRIAEEQDVQIGAEVGYTIRFDDRTSSQSRVVIMTDGILLQEVRKDPDLSRYGVILIDEAHERSLNIDFCLGLLHGILARRPELRVLISSATLQPERFVEFFRDRVGEVPVVQIQAEPHPVEIVWRPLIGQDPDELADAVAREVAAIHRAGHPGHVLVFLSGEDAIRRAGTAIGHQHLGRELVVLPLYGALTREDQERVFEPFTGRRKIVLATNIAETSITIDDIRHVLDSGLAKVPRVSFKTGITLLREEGISRASADQRKGRAGRTAPGRCVRFYSQDSYRARPAYTDEEILRLDLSETVLRLIDLGVRKVEDFAFPTSPPPARLRGALDALLAMGAIDRERHLTHVGERMVPFPLSPQLARMVVEAAEKAPDVVDEVLVVAAFLSGRSPLQYPPGREDAARKAQAALAQPLGDAVTAVRLYRGWQKSEEREAYCQRLFLDGAALAFIANAHRQIRDIAEGLGIVCASGGDPLGITRAVTAGFAQNILIGRGRFFESASGERIYLHPSSALYNQAPRFVVAAEIVISARAYARQVSVTRAAWVAELRPDLAERWQLKADRLAKGEGEKKPEVPRQIELGGLMLEVDARKGRPRIDIPFEAIEQLKTVLPADLPPGAAAWQARIVQDQLSFAQGTPLGALLPLLRFLPLPPKGADLRCTVPEGALLEVDLNLHTLARHLPRLLAPMASSDRRRPGWVMLVANGGGGYWYEIGMDFREVLEVTLLSLEDLALNLAEGDPLAADIEARIEQIRPQLDEVHEALAAARKSRRVQKV